VSRDPGHAQLGVGLWSVRRRGTSSMRVPNWSGYLYSFKSYKGFPKFRNWVTWPRPRQLRGHFMVYT